MTNLDWAQALHSKAVWTAIASAVVAFVVALGVPLTAAQEGVLEVVVGGMFTTVFGSLLVAQAHVKAATTATAPIAMSTPPSTPDADA